MGKHLAQSREICVRVGVCVCVCVQVQQAAIDVDLRNQSPKVERCAMS